MKCDIIIPVWNQLDFTRDCLENLVKNTRQSYTLILVDNASGDETKAYLDGLKDRLSLEIIIIRNEENIGFVKAVNQGLKVSKSPYICVMNNDTIPAPGWLERMIAFAETHKDIGLINPLCNGHGDMSIEEYANILAERNKGRYMEMNQCQGFCMLIKRELFNKVGYMDESFGIGGFDDTDYSMRAHMAGYRSVSLHDAYVYHRMHASFNEAGDRENWVRRNEKIYYNKWGKHLRIGLMLFLKSPVSAKEVSRALNFAYGLAREWTWVHIWVNVKDGRDAVKEAMCAVLREDGLPPHQNIRISYFDLPNLIFETVIGVKLVERMRRRMRDKRFDAMVFLNDKPCVLLPSISRLLNMQEIRIDSGCPISSWEEEGRKIALAVKGKRDHKVGEV